MKYKLGQKAMVISSGEPDKKHFLAIGSVAEVVSVGCDGMYECTGVYESGSKSYGQTVHESCLAPLDVKMSTRWIDGIVDVLWDIIASNVAYTAIKYPEDKAEVLNELINRLDEEMNQLTPDRGWSD